MDSVKSVGGRASISLTVTLEHDSGTLGSPLKAGNAQERRRATPFAQRTYMEKTHEIEEELSDLSYAVKHDCGVSGMKFDEPEEQTAV